MALFKKKQKLEIEFTEKEVILDMIDIYIDIANKNDTTVDDYISIIALIKMLQTQYTEYASDLQKYIELFRDKGILDEYQTYMNTTKRVFIDNNFQPNTELAERMVYGYFEGATSRFINYLIIYGLCGRPVTPRQKYIMASIFEGNSWSFKKQKIYYSKLYLNDSDYISGMFFSKKEKEECRRGQISMKYKSLAEAYKRDTEEYKLYMEKSKEYK